MVAQETVVKTSSSKKFLREVKAELKKVSWPTKQELISNTGIVFISVLVVTGLIKVVDMVFSYALNAFIK